MECSVSILAKDSGYLSWNEASEVYGPVVMTVTHPASMCFLYTSAAASGSEDMPLPFSYSVCRVEWGSLLSSAPYMLSTLKWSSRFTTRMRAQALLASKLPSEKMLHPFG